MVIEIKNGIYRDGKNKIVEQFKKTTGLKGDVFIVNHYMYSLKSYKETFNSSVRNIVDAYKEYLTKYKGKESEYALQEWTS